MCLLTFSSLTAVTARAHCGRAVGFNIIICPGVADESSYSAAEALEAVADAAEDHSKFLQRKEIKSKRNRLEFSHLSGASTSPMQGLAKKQGIRRNTGATPRQLPIGEAFKAESWAAADDAVCRFFYDGAVSMTKCDRLSFRDAIKSIIAAGPGYKFRGKTFMRSDGLRKEKERPRCCSWPRRSCPSPRP
jgi:hypothetical protein